MTADTPEDLSWARATREGDRAGRAAIAAYARRPRCTAQEAAAYSVALMGAALDVLFRLTDDRDAVERTVFAAVRGWRHGQGGHLLDKHGRRVPADLP